MFHHTEDTCSTVFAEALCKPEAKPETGKNPDVPQLKKGSRKCGTFTKWNAIQLFIMNFAGKWMKLENVIHSKVDRPLVRQTQKDMHGMCSLISRY